MIWPPNPSVLLSDPKPLPRKVSVTVFCFPISLSLLNPLSPLLFTSNAVVITD